MWMKCEVYLLHKKGLMLDPVLFISEESELARAESHLLRPLQIITLRVISIIRIQQPRLPARCGAPRRDSLHPPDSLLRWARLLFPLHTGELRLGEGSRWELSYRRSQNPSPASGPQSPC